MPHPYLELTHLDRILEGGIIDQKQATDYQTLVHSSKDHVAICPEVANISGELMYLHAAVTDNNSKVNTTFFSDCLVLEKSSLLEGGGLSVGSSPRSHVSAIPCIILNQAGSTAMSSVLYGAGAEESPVQSASGQSMLYQGTGPAVDTSSSSALDDCPLPKSATKVRFSE